MQKVLEQSKYLVWMAIVSLWVAAVLGFFVGIAKTVVALWDLGYSYGLHPQATLYLIRVADTFLVATVLLVFAISLYELFIGDLAVPDWMVVRNLLDLEAKLAGVIVLVLAVKFLEKLMEAKNAIDTLYTALAIAVVSAVLISFQNAGLKGK